MKRVVKGLCGGRARASCGSCSSSQSVVACGVVLVGTAECRRESPTYWAPGAVLSCLGVAPFGVEMPVEARGVRGMHSWVWKCQWGCQM